MKKSKEKRELARICKAPDLVIEDHGLLILDLVFEYRGGSAAQGFPIIVQGPGGGGVIKGVLEAVGCVSWRALAGKSCYVTQRDGLIKKIEPRLKRDGKAFDLDEFNKTTR